MEDDIDSDHDDMVKESKALAKSPAQSLSSASPQSSAPGSRKISTDKPKGRLMRNLLPFNVDDMVDLNHFL